MLDGDFRVRGKEILRVEGLSDAVFGFAIALTALLLFTVLVFVYPLKFIMSALVGTMFRNLGFPDPSSREIAVIPKPDLRALFMAFGFGFAAVFGVFSAMYRHAYALREKLQLDAVETFDTLEFVRVTTRVSILGLVIGSSYAFTLMFPRFAGPISNVGGVAVLAAFAVVIRQRRTRGTRRLAFQEQQVGAEA